MIENLGLQFLDLCCVVTSGEISLKRKLEICLSVLLPVMLDQVLERAHVTR